MAITLSRGKLQKKQTVVFKRVNIPLDEIFPTGHLRNEDNPDQ